MNALPLGYTLREDGLYEKIVHFGSKGMATEILLRDKHGRLIRVIREEHHQNKSPQRGGVDYDIRIPKIGFSGVKKP